MSNVKLFRVNGKLVRVEKVPNLQGCLPIIVVVVCMVLGFNFVKEKIHIWRYQDEWYNQKYEQIAWTTFKEQIATKYHIPMKAYQYSYYGIKFQSPFYQGEETKEYESTYWGYGTYQFNTKMIYDNHDTIELSIYMDRNGNDWTLGKIVKFKSNSTVMENLSEELRSANVNLNKKVKSNGSNSEILEQRYDVETISGFINAYNGLKNEVSFKE